MILRVIWKICLCTFAATVWNNIFHKCICYSSYSCLQLVPRNIEDISLLTLAYIYNTNIIKRLALVTSVTEKLCKMFMVGYNWQESMGDMLGIL